MAVLHKRYFDALRPRPRSIIVIVPDGPVSNTTSGGTVVNTPDLGPDPFGGTPIG